ncbi:MAG TPA: hypothetical protein VND91_12720 [Candidatus Saccharimonadia bacterium]|nr:hypothetical protein [Candidatus Saccharimonadia bacterium]
MRTPLIAALACTMLAACASNEIEKPMTNQGETMHFKNLDRSEDLKLTRDELPNDHELYLAFEAHDLNGDGAISEHEFGEYLQDLD